MAKQNMSKAVAKTEAKGKTKAKALKAGSGKQATAQKKAAAGNNKSASGKLPGKPAKDSNNGKSTDKKGAKTQPAPKGNAKITAGATAKHGRSASAKKTVKSR